MPRPVGYLKAKDLEDKALQPGQRKLCEPLKEWRTDGPLPYCITCSHTIQVGKYYVVAYPNQIFCRPCGDPSGKLR